MRERVSSRVSLFLLIVSLAACGGGGSTPNNPSPPPTGGNSVQITIPSSDGYGSSSFSPAGVTVAVGTTVSWSNRDSIAHTTTAENGIWNTTLNAGGEFSRVFSTTGTFDYRCTLHPGMSGSVTVR